MTLKAAVQQVGEDEWAAWMDYPEAMALGTTCKEALQLMVVDHVSNILADGNPGEIYMVDQPANLVVVLLDDKDAVLSGWRSSIFVPRRIEGDEKIVMEAMGRPPIEE